MKGFKSIMGQSFMKHIQYKLLHPLQKRALDEAAKAMEDAYNPYSHFYVGAAVYTDKGTIVTGANFENSVYSPTICAERSAIVRANVMGLRTFKGIAVIARSKDTDIQEVISPCGVCRQVLFELSSLSNTDLEVIMSNTQKSKILLSSSKELLPFAFGLLDEDVDLSQYQR